MDVKNAPPPQTPRPETASRAPRGIKFPSRLAKLLTLTPTAYGEYFDLSVAPQAGEKFKAADYHLWIPDGVKRLRGIVIRQHGCGDPAVSTGLSNANDLQWQALAARHGCALLGPRLTTHKACEDWANPDAGEAADGTNRATQKGEGLSAVGKALFARVTGIACDRSRESASSPQQRQSPQRQ